MSDDFDDLDGNGFLGPQGCLFPSECCMPDIHYTSECHTLEDLVGPEEAKRIRRWDRQTQRERRKARQLHALVEKLMPLVNHLCGMRFPVTRPE